VIRGVRKKVVGGLRWKSEEATDETVFRGQERLTDCEADEKRLITAKKKEHF